MILLPTIHATDITPISSKNSLFVGRYYAAHFLRPQNNESGEPDIKNIGDKSQDENKFILHNDIRNERGYQITDMIQEFDPSLLR